MSWCQRCGYNNGEFEWPCRGCEAPETFAVPNRPEHYIQIPPTKSTTLETESTISQPTVHERRKS